MTPGSLIYIASPYSHPDDNVRESNFRIVSEFVAKLTAEGLKPISPITYGHTLLGFHDMPSDWQFWQDFCITFLQHCDELWVYQMPGWDRSRGVAEEIEYAEKNGIKIKYISYDKSN